MKIGFIGGGNMAEGIIAGLVQNFLPSSIFVADPSLDRQTVLKDRYEINTFDHHRYFLSEVDFIVLAIKPQGFASFLPEIAPLIQKKQVVISIAAGVTIDVISDLLDESFAIVRAMPNMPAKVGHGVTGLFANAHVSDDQKNVISEIFEGCGMATWVKEEAHINAVIAVAGSSPAYFFYFAQLVGQMGAKLGLNAEVATKMAVQTMLGSAKLADIGDVNLDDLIRSICSPKGTTEQAMISFKESNLDSIVEKAMLATVERSEVLAEELTQQIKGS
ncbi:pyrroline-5-carboxylate reductase [Wohlfahrtiimonas larvae]|uniref:Pyrroline-5-carboxylate reductase n=1 Tax=Wohlfahrtiimonas larvae TaxID=1157986 RepID=A0ABP9MRK8_9GAMM|nr:pyrroline-5-carboxylate reductase [Wohlfahrtiimonas larvae]